MAIFGTVNTQSEVMTNGNNATSDVIIAYKNADESVTNSIVLQDDNHLIVNIAGNTKYEIRMMLFWTTAGVTSGLRFSFAGTAVISSIKAVVQSFNETLDSLSSIIRITDTGQAGNVGLTGDNSVFAVGTVEVSAPGTFILQWAQNVASNDATTVQRNSMMSFIKVG